MKAAHRVARLRIRIADQGIGALAVMNPVNVAYLTGFENVFDHEMAHVALVSADAQLLLTDSRYFEACSSSAGDEGVWDVRCVDNVDEALLEAFEDGRLGLETSVPYARLKRLLDKLGDKGEPVGGWIEALREVKDAAEIERIAEAQALTDLAFDHILTFVRPGLTERSIALELEFFMRSRGSEGVAFDPIVASGPHSALPHAKVTDRELRSGDFLKLDFGARVRGYCADMTRTIVIGQADAWQREIHSATLAANRAGIAAITEGATGSSADRAAREVLESMGLAEKFTHGLGHGVGLEVHERPGLNRRNEAPLPAGAVVTVEPGVYEPGRGGVRIEDLVVVQADGARVLTRSSKELIEL